MKVVRPRLTKLAAVYLFTASVPFAYCQTAPAPKPATNSKTNAIARSSSTIEFSGPATAPALPKPGSSVEELKGRFGISDGGSGSSINPTPDLGQPTQTVPTRAALEKAWREWDKKKNWAVPGADEKKSDDPTKALLKDEGLSDENSLSGNKRESVMDRYISGSDSKSKRPGQGRGKESESERDRDRDRDNRSDSELKSDKEQKEEAKNTKLNDPESNGLSQFSLGAFINPNTQHTAFGDMSQPGKDRWSQPLKNDFTSAPKVDKARNDARNERNDADFQQLLKPRSGGATVGPASGFPDPVNFGADMTRREINPVLPRGLESRSPAAPAFGGISPARDSFRADNSGMFGVTGPGGASFAPTVSAPVANPTSVTRPAPLVHEAPRHLF